MTFRGIVRRKTRIIISIFTIYDYKGKIIESISLFFVKQKRKNAKKKGIRSFFTYEKRGIK
jgi:hypothetical protein